MSDYIFDTHAEERELRRLRMIETAVDADTIALLERTGVTTGWTCLELGAGAGSIVEWLGRTVGPNGRVWAVDRRTAYLGRFSTEPYRVVESDFGDLVFDDSVDLLHARYVLIHNQRADHMLNKMRTLIKPGGYVVLEEPDFTSAGLLNARADAACRRVNEAICRMFSNAGLDPGYGLRLPQEMEKAGLKIAETKAAMHLCRGQTPIAAVMAESASALRDKYTETGVATGQDIGRYVADAGDPSKWSVYYATVSVVAKAG